LTNRDTIIYVVDDDEAIRRALGRLLRASGFVVETYASALAFLGDAPVLHSACLLLDMRMPGMSGLELLEHMADSGMDVPTILITAHAEELDWEGYRPPVFACLQKPVRERRLLDLIEEGLSK